MAGLLRSFFAFLASRDGSALRGASVIHAQEYRAPSGVIFLEDPAEFLETRQQSNLASTVGEPQWQQIIQEGRKASDRLVARPQRWFHWAEVFDPREVPGDRLRKLESLNDAAKRARVAQEEFVVNPMAMGKKGDGKGLKGDKGESKGDLGKGPWKGDGKGDTGKGLWKGKGEGSNMVPPPPSKGFDKGADKGVAGFDKGLKGKGDVGKEKQRLRQGQRLWFLSCSFLRRCWARAHGSAPSAPGCTRRGRLFPVLGGRGHSARAGKPGG